MYLLVATVCQFSTSNRLLKNLAFRSYAVLLQSQRNDITSAPKKEDDTRVLKKRASEMKTRASWTAKNYRRITMHRSRYVVFDRSQGDVIIRGIVHAWSFISVWKEQLMRGYNIAMEAGIRFRVRRYFQPEWITGNGFGSAINPIKISETGFLFRLPIA